jgi:hypothetical protein
MQWQSSMREPTSSSWGQDSPGRVRPEAEKVKTGLAADERG